MSVVREKMPGTLLDVEEATAHAFSYMMDEKASHQLFSRNDALLLSILFHSVLR